MEVKNQEVITQVSKRTTSELIPNIKPASEALTAVTFWKEIRPIPPKTCRFQFGGIKCREVYVPSRHNQKHCLYHNNDVVVRLKYFTKKHPTFEFIECKEITSMGEARLFTKKKKKALEKEIPVVDTITKPVADQLDSLSRWRMDNKNPDPDPVTKPEENLSDKSESLDSGKRFDPSSFDAREWAAEFARCIAVNPDIPSDQDCMLTWFSSALMAGHDYVKRNQRSTLSQLQDEIHDWSLRNFGPVLNDSFDYEMICTILMIAESFGRCCHAALKTAENIRGDAGTHRQEYFRGISEIRQAINSGTVLQARDFYRVITKNGYRVSCLLGMFEEMAEMLRGMYKGDDSDVSDAIGDTMVFFADFCARNSRSLDEKFIETWDKVKLRDWKKNKHTGQV